MSFQKVMKDYLCFLGKGHPVLHPHVCAELSWVSKKYAQRWPALISSCQSSCQVLMKKVFLERQKTWPGNCTWQSRKLVSIDKTSSMIPQSSLIQCKINRLNGMYIRMVNRVSDIIKFIFSMIGYPEAVEIREFLGQYPKKSRNLNFLRLEKIGILRI